MREQGIKEISEHTQAVKILEMESRFYTLFNSISEAVLIHDEDGNIIDVNLAAREMLGYSRDELMDMNTSDFAKPGAANILPDDMQKMAELGLGCFETVYITKDNKEIDTEVTPRYMEILGKKNFICFARNISEEKETRKELGESLEKFRLIFDHSPLGIIHFNKDGEVTACNNTHLKILGSTRDKVIGFNMLTSLRDENMKNIVRKSLMGIQTRYEGRYVSTTGGNETYIKCDFAPINDSSGNVIGAFGIVEDITERKVAEQELKKSEKELRNLNNIKDKYLNIINDDIKRGSQYVYSHFPNPIKKGEILTDWHFVPTKDLGGDSIGYHYIDEDHFAVYLLDVSGHGIGPALHAVSVLNMIKYQTLPGTDFTNPAEVMSSLNKTFQMTEHNFLYITMWYCVYDLRRGKLNCCGAAHPPLLLIGPEGKWLTVESRSMMIGARPDTVYQNQSFAIDHDTSLYLYSDGVSVYTPEENKMTEIEDSFRFLEKNRKEDASEIRLLYNHIKKLSGKKTLNDDFSIIKVLFK